MKRLMEALARISKLPGTDGAAWLSSAESSVEFLKQSTESDRMVLYASMPCVFIQAVLAPLEHLDPPNEEELSREFMDLDDSWAIEHVSGGGKPERVYLAPPMHGHGQTLQHGEKLVFRRSFAGSPECPIELSQKLVHALDLHYIPERSAYCRLDEDGDVVEVIKVTEESGDDWTQDVTAVTILAKDFAEYMRLVGMGMVIFFDFTRVRFGSFQGWSSDHKRFEHKARDLFYHGGVMPGHASHVNGRMIVRPAITLEEIVQARKEARDPANRQYATFKAINLKTGKRIEVSCNPKGLSNYFHPESTLPLEMSPVFFRAEVLHRYKADPQKYELAERSIYCRGTWSLETFDINNVGQVHTYLRYLGYLPYKEQLYWQSFNEWPKGALSKRAIATDFKGEFYTEYDSLNSLKHKIQQLDEGNRAWWQPRGQEPAKTVHYPATASAAEWANEILALDHLLIEGFRVKGLRGMLKALRRTFEPDWKSLKLLEECLIGSGVDEEDARTAVTSLRTLHDLRTILKGHSAATKKSEAEKQAIAKFGSFRAHFAQSAAECDSALKLIMDTLSGA
jgi:hypothetical protein